MDIDTHGVFSAEYSMLEDANGEELQLHIQHAVEIMLAGLGSPFR